MTAKNLYGYVSVMVVMAVLLSAVPVVAQPPTTMKKCTACHAPEANVVRGTFLKHSERFKSVLVDVGSGAWIFGYGDATKLEGAESLSGLKRGNEVSIAFTGSEDRPLATRIFVKQPFRLPDKQVVTVEEMEALVEQGPEKGGYVLIDSRPLEEHISGHIPGARSIPFAVLKLQGERILPKEKSAPLIFYCNGVTSAFSPESSRLAEGLGYTNIRVFQAGMPAWRKNGNIVVSEPKYIKDMTSEGASFVLIDLRPEKIAMGGFIRGAVSIPTDQLQSSLWMFPKDKSAPIIIYGNSGFDAAAFRMVSGWGYENTSVLNDGLAGWIKSNGTVFRGRIGFMVGYVKLVPRGQVGEREFRSVAEKRPADKIILDVRAAETAAEGTVSGAVLIPQAELTDRISELPKDREILIYSSTGSKAFTAYELLTRAGYRTRYLDAIVQADKDGYYEITEK